MAAGFIYKWSDLKKHKFYIGSHWGSQTDGYICSSPWMLRAFKKRSQDFSREILELVDDRSKILEREEHWLSFIPDHQLGVTFYNLTKKTGHWHVNAQSLKSVSSKLHWTVERKAKMKLLLSNVWNRPGHRENFRLKTAGRLRTTSTKQKMRDKWTSERREAQANRLRAVTAKRFLNYKRIKPTKKELDKLYRLQNPIDLSQKSIDSWAKVAADPIKYETVKKKMSEAKIGKIWVNRDGIVKLVQPHEELTYINNGWLRGLGKREYKSKPVSEETKKKIAEKLRGSVRSKETKEKISQSLKMYAKSHNL